MDQETLTRAIISNLIDRYIPEIAEDTNRSVRKMVDMVERISDGHFQKILCQMMQTMAQNQNSPYYDLIQDMARNTDKNRLKTFGIDLGYNSWTCGARNIRLMEMESGQFIPWVITFLREEGGNTAPFSDLARLVAEARKKEIYSYFFLYRGSLSEWDELETLIRKNPDCAFGLLLDGCLLDEAMIGKLGENQNVTVVVNTQQPGWQEAAERLRKDRMLFAFYRTYTTEEDAQEIIGGKWIESVLPYHGISAAVLPTIDCPEAIAEKVSRAISNFRLNQTYPIMPADLVSDCLIISDIISYKKQILAVAPDGRVLRADQHTLKKMDFNVSSASLDEILQHLS